MLVFRRHFPRTNMLAGMDIAAPDLQGLPVTRVVDLLPASAPASDTAGGAAR